MKPSSFGVFGVEAGDLLLAGEFPPICGSDTSRQYLDTTTVGSKIAL
jgi:hypothetical protein